MPWRLSVSPREFGVAEQRSNPGEEDEGGCQAEGVLSTSVCHRGGDRRRLVDETVLVSEEEMCGAIRLLVSEVRVIAEGAGAAPTAAAAKMDLKGKKVAAMVSGRNLTAEHLKIILAGGVPKP